MQHSFPRAVYERNAEVYHIMANISQHLAVLRSHRLVKIVRKGTTIF